ncbi:conserved hypothetical protein [Ricinus communis]|uniref:Uncharacterized protein n=1 Tax=Ricinus communis TaxID=3988 RepID=B9TMY2_RICCO|nr:conserved hypothetical protein [Ricinus communis]
MVGSKALHSGCQPKSPRRGMVGLSDMVILASGSWRLRRGLCEAMSKAPLLGCHRYPVMQT